MAVIFLLSATPDLRSGLQAVWDTVLRKAAHVGEYAVLAWLSARAFRISGLGQRRAAVAGLALAALYAGSDEWHQTFVVGRNGNLVDWGIDAAGAALGSLISLRRIPKAW